MSHNQINEFNKLLQNFNIKAKCTDYKNIDNYFFYDLKLNPQTQIKDISKFTNEISLFLKTPCKPNIKIIHQDGILRLEFAEPRVNRLNLFDYFTNSDIPNGNLTCLLGQSSDGSRLWMDLSKNPHMIVSGTTGSGKSTLLHNVIANLFNYNKVNLYLVDPKNIEFLEYDKKIKNDVNVYYSYSETIFVLDQLLELMENRYLMLRDGFPEHKLPYVVLIIDEFADLILQDEDNQFYNKLCRLAQKCRAAKIHIILSTQRPSVNIINGAIKANFPARISCKVASAVDSRIILDASGAESLIGQGDALLRDNYRNLERFQIAYTDSIEVCKYFGDINGI